MRKLLLAFRRHLLFKLMMTACICCLLCLMVYPNKMLHARTVLTLNYADAAVGNSLNGTRYNINSLLEHRILNEAIRRSGCEGLLTAAELADMLSVMPGATRASEQQYITTEYQVDLVLEHPLGSVDARGLLTQVMQSYIDLTYDDYIGNYAMLDADGLALSAMDYHEAGAALRTRAQLISEYMDLRKQENSAFVSTATGESFASLQQQAEDYISIVLSKYMAFVRNRGVSRNPDQYIAQIQYMNRTLQLEYDSYMLRYNQCRQGIEDYREDQTGIVLIPTDDGAGSFYMSKTKTGIDYLAAEANEAMQHAKDIALEMDKYSEWRKNVRSGNTEEDRQYAQALLQTCTQELDQLQRRMLETDEEYIQTVLYRSLLYSPVAYVKPSFLTERTFVMLAVGVFMAQVAVQAIAEHRRAKREQAMEEGRP